MGRREIRGVNDKENSGTHHDGDKSEVVLTLYVLSKTAQSSHAVATIQGICSNELVGRCRLDIVDVSENPEVAERDAIIATPTLIKLAPPPLRRILGDLSSSEEVLVALQLS
ncbi:MAG: circadian clock KaiB family protein [Exilibacterium sp.]